MNFSRSSVSFIDDSEQKNFEETDYLVPETHYSPKDKVSNATWNNKLPVGNVWESSLLVKMKFSAASFNLTTKKLGG